MRSRTPLALASALAAALLGPATTALADWCDDARAGEDGVLGTADDRPECVSAPGVDVRTSCDTEATDLWVFAQDWGCIDCPRTLYLPVQCPGDLHLIVSSIALEVRVSALTGPAETPLELVAVNSCADRAGTADPLVYCEGCGTGEDYLLRRDQPSTRLEKPAGTCVSGTHGPLPERPCLPLRVEGTAVAWGPPLDLASPDADGDGVLEAEEMQPPPCELCVDCECGADSIDNAALRDQGQRVLVRDVPAPVVLRLDFRNGDHLWYVAANCTAVREVGLQAYADRSAAEAVLDTAPAPRLELDPDPETAFGIVSGAGCPDSVRVRVTTCNAGSAAASRVPFAIRDADGTLVLEADQADHPTDPACLGDLLPGECRSCEWDLSLGMAAGELELVLDPADEVAECDETASPATCAPSRRSARLTPCVTPACGAVARLSADRTALCLGESLVADASASLRGSCSGTTLFTFVSATGAVLPGGETGPEPLRTLTPELAGDDGLVVRMECDSDPACTDEAGPLPLRVAPVELDFPSAVSAVAEGECAVRVTWDPPLAGEPPFAYELYRSESLPVPLDAAHRIAAGLTEPRHLDEGWHGPSHYRVVAVGACASAPNGGGDGAAASPVDATPPSFAGIVDTRDLGGCEVEVSWDEATAEDACSGVVSYNVYRDHGVGHAGETLVAEGVPGSPHVDTTPGNGTWVYVVRAVDAAGNEEQNTVFQQESEGSCTNDFPRDAGLDRENGVDPPNADAAAPPPGLGELEPVVTGFRRTLGAGELRISWTPSADEDGPYLVTYAVLRGSLAALAAGVHDHELATPESCGLLEREALLPDQPAGSHYYLVVPVAGDNATFGYDSEGRERPAAEACYLR